jgi:hypothetical protein
MAGLAHSKLEVEVTVKDERDDSVMSAAEALEVDEDYNEAHLKGITS